MSLAGLGGYVLSGGVKRAAPPAAAPVPTAAPSGAAAGATGSATTGASATAWTAAAPGRIEPKSGEVRIGGVLPGRIAEVLVKVNDKVEDGEMIVRIDDTEARARLAAAEAEAGARKQERDQAPATTGREDIRKAEDAIFLAERAVTGARYELDGALAQRRNGSGDEAAVTGARKRLAEATDRLQRERVAFAQAQSKPNLPSPSRLDSGVSAARAEVNVAQAILDRTRVRSPINGHVLQLAAKTGEILSPTPEAPLAVLGDMTALRVKAEIDEGDVAKVKVGQKAFVKTISFPGREFQGKVTALAPSLAPPRLGARGPRRPTDVEVLEVTVELDGATPLLPGMRVDAFFKRD